MMADAAAREKRALKWQGKIDLELKAHEERWRGRGRIIMPTLWLWGNPKLWSKCSRM
jgi:hypothetical protein